MALLSCRHPDGPTPPPRPTPSGTTTPAPTTAPHPKCHVDESELPPIAPTGDLEPSAQVFGLPYMRLDHAWIAFADGVDPSVLLLTGEYDVRDINRLDLPPTLVVPGKLEPGRHCVLDLWDGVSSIDEGVLRDAAPAGDSDGDGHGDLWVGEELFRGPFLGRALHSHDPGNAWIKSKEASDGIAVVAGFDADGDGNEDALFQASCCQLAYLRYGPFDGEIASAALGAADPATYTTFQGTCFDAVGTEFLPDQLGAGHHAVALGFDYGGWCTWDTYVWDLMQPPGLRLTDGDAFARSWMTGNGAYVRDAGDQDGDGRPDVIYGDEFGSQIVKGPLEGDLDVYYSGPVALPRGPYSRFASAGDVNGDGTLDFLAEDNPAFAWVLLLSPHGDPGQLGLVLGTTSDLPHMLGSKHADLDRDGLEDLIESEGHGTWGVTPDDLFEAGEINVWYGADLVAAWNAKRAGAR